MDKNKLQYRQYFDGPDKFDLAKEPFAELILYLSCDALERAIEQAKEQAYDSVYVDMLIDQLEKLQQPEQTSQSTDPIEDLVTSMVDDFFPDLSPEERHEKAWDSYEFVEALLERKRLDRAYKYN